MGKLILLLANEDKQGETTNNTGDIVQRCLICLNVAFFGQDLMIFLDMKQHTTNQIGTYPPAIKHGNGKSPT